MADQGFTGYLSDFAGAIKENGADIMRTTVEIEKLIKDALERFTDDEKLNEMKEAIGDTLKPLLEGLKKGEIFNTAALKAQFDEVVKQVGDSTDINLSSPLDPGDIFKSVTESIPVETFPEEFKKTFIKIEEFFSTIDLSDVRIEISTINNPVKKPAEVGDNDDCRPIQGSDGVIELPSNFDIFGQQASAASNASGTGATSEDPFAGVLDKIEDIFSREGGGSVITDLLIRLDTALVDAVFYAALEEKNEAFLKIFDADDLTIEKLVEAVVELVSGLIGLALDTLEAILEFLFDDLKKIFSLFLKNLPDLESIPFVEVIFEQLGIQEILKEYPDYNPGLLSLPAFLISVPFTLLSIAATGQRPEFPSISQEDPEDWKNIGKGVVQFVLVVSLVALLKFSYKPERGQHSIPNAVLKDILVLEANIFDQITTEPKGDWKKTLWYLKWGTSVGWSVIALFGKLYIDLKQHKQPQQSLFDAGQTPHPDINILRRLDKIFPSVQVLFGICHFGFNIGILFSGEAEEDQRLKATYWLNALPGIVDGGFTLAQVPKYRKLENTKEKAESEKLKTHLKWLEAVKIILNTGLRAALGSLLLDVGLKPPKRN